MPKDSEWTVAPGDHPPSVYIQNISVGSGGQANILQDGAMYLGASAPPSGSSLDRLRAISETAVADCDIIAPRDGQSVVRLADGAYVRRAVEERLLRRLERASVTALVGEAGYGKSVLLWQIHHRLDAIGRAPLLIPATALVGDASRTAAISIEMIGEGLRESPASRQPVLLVDTLDLMLHDLRTRQQVNRLLNMAAQAKVPTLVTSRPVEARMLDLSDNEADEQSVSGGRIAKVTLYDYDRRERAEAISTYAQHFYPPEKVSGAIERLENATVRGLPLQEVCRNPLALRLLFELYAPDDLPETDIDTIGLYDQYWLRRVATDIRGPDSTGSAPDLTLHAEGAGLVLLSRGSTESAKADLVEQMRPLSNKSAIRAEDGVDAMHARGVLRMPPNSRRLRFFHQTFFEHAAARAVAAAGEPAARVLLNYVRNDPHDLFYGEVAAQLLLLSERRLILGGFTSGVLGDWLNAAERGLQVLGLRTYARMSDPRAELRVKATQILETCETDMAADYLALLPSVHHRSFERVGSELSVLWHRATSMQERPETVRQGRSIALNTLEALSRLAASHPERVIGFVDDHRCIAWLMALPLDDWRNHTSLYLRLMESLYNHAPRWCGQVLTTFFERFAAAGKPGGASEILELFNRYPLPPLAEESMERILAAIRTFQTTENALRLELEYVRLRERWLTELTAAQLLERTQSMLGDSDWQTVGRRAELRALSQVALGLADDEAAGYLATLLRERDRRGQEDLLTVLGKALEEAEDPPPPLIVHTRRRCREELARLPAKLQQDGSRPLPVLFVNALYGARTEGSALLSALPEDPHDELWSDPHGLMPLITPAALAGHDAAIEALHSLLVTPHVASTATAKVRRAVLGRLREAALRGSPEALGHLLVHAENELDVTLICEILRQRTAADEDPTAGCGARIGHLRESLVAAGDRAVAVQGHRLWSVLVERRVEPYPTPSELAASMAGRPGYPLLISLFNLTDACLRGGVWIGADVSTLVKAIFPYMTPRTRSSSDLATERATTVATSARRLLIGLHARHTELPVDPIRQRDFAMEVMTLVYDTDYDLEVESERAAFTGCVTEAGRLLHRIDDPTTIIELVLDAARHLHEMQPHPTRWRRDAAQAWHPAIIDAVIGASPAERPQLISELLSTDLQMARLAVAACVDRIRPIPGWLQDLVSEMPPEVHKRMRGVMNRNARDGSPRSLPELYEKSVIAAHTL